jgi:CheY-like chemotaxis protein
MAHSTKKARVLLADDHALVAVGLHSMLAATYDVVGTVDNGRALVQAAECLHPDVILLDISISDYFWTLKDFPEIVSHRGHRGRHREHREFPEDFSVFSVAQASGTDKGFKLCDRCVKRSSLALSNGVAGGAAKWRTICRQRPRRADPGIGHPRGCRQPARRAASPGPNLREP